MPHASSPCGLALAALLTSAGGCGSTALVLSGPPHRPFEAVVVPGCPVNPDGQLSRCLQSRVLWASILWERGWAKNFIVSGAAVHSPWVEAEAMAAGLSALGVPAERIWLEPEALHTDENMYNSAQIARALGIRTVAVASNGGHALWGCRMMLDWGQECRALPVDSRATEERRRRAGGALQHLALRRVTPEEFRPLAEREEARARAQGRRRRPSSFLLYASVGQMQTNGEVWIPFSPATPTLETWADRLAGQPAGLALPMAPGTRARRTTGPGAGITRAGP